MDRLALHNAGEWIKMFHETMQGTELKPRGLAIRECEDLQIQVWARYPFMTFADRHYDISYFKKEMLWKLSANKHDSSIMQHAKMWESVRNPDGTFNSNYGQFWFGEQNGFWGVVQELTRDQDSRRAVIPMLSKEHMKPETVDTVCTESVGFRIRDGALNMSVHMRSSDQIFGLGTDIPTFAFLYRLVKGTLGQVYPDLQWGKITLTAMSSHIYQRHYEMVKAILAEGMAGYYLEEMPECSAAEALRIVSSRGKDLTGTGELGEWLVS